MQEASIHGSNAPIQGSPWPSRSSTWPRSEPAMPELTTSAQATPAPALRLAHTMTAVVHP